MPIKELEFINFRLEVVENFLDKNLKSISAEQAVICEQKEIVIRAVYYELSAIIEFMFQNFAMDSYHKSQTKHSKFIGDKGEYEIEKIKFVSKLGFGDLKEEIEKAHNFKFDDLKNCDYKKIKQIRQITINFKHRRGYKYPDKYTWSEIELSPESKPSREETYQAVDEVKNLFKILQKKIEPESKIEILESELENIE